jgi:hypothetical protein
MAGVGRKTKALLASSAVALVACASAGLRYHDYACAVAWHCRHGNYATFPGYRVKLPIFWWEEKDTLRWERYFLKRACAGSLCTEPEIEITHVLPSQEASIPVTDQQEIKEKQNAIDEIRARERPSQVSASLGLKPSLVTIRAQSATLVCIRVEMQVEKRVAERSLACDAPRFPYTLSTITYWQPAAEREAELILSTLK